MYLFEALRRRAATRPIPSYYGPTSVWVFTLSVDGKLISISEKPVSMVVPGFVRQGTGVVPGNPVVDTAKYLFAATDPGRMASDSQPARAVMEPGIQELPKRFAGTPWEPAARAVVAFLTASRGRVAAVGHKLDPDTLDMLRTTEPVEQRKGKIPPLLVRGKLNEDAVPVWACTHPGGSDALVFPGQAREYVLLVVEGFEGWILSPEMQRYVTEETRKREEAAEAKANADPVYGECSVCARYDEYVRITHHSGKGKLKLVSFGKPAFERYGVSMGHNARMCYTCSLAIADGVADLMERAKLPSSAKGTGHLLWSQTNPDLDLMALWQQIFPVRPAAPPIDSPEYAAYIEDRDKAIAEISKGGDLHYLCWGEAKKRMVVRRYHRIQGADLAERLRAWIAAMQYPNQKFVVTPYTVAVNLTRHATKDDEVGLARRMETIYWQLIGDEPPYDYIVEDLRNEAPNLTWITREIRAAWIRYTRGKEHPMNAVETMQYHLGAALALADRAHKRAVKFDPKVKTIRATRGDAMARNPDLAFRLVNSRSDFESGRLTETLNLALAAVDKQIPRRMMRPREITCFWAGYTEMKGRLYAERIARGEGPEPDESNESEINSENAMEAM